MGPARPYQVFRRLSYGQEVQEDSAEPGGGPPDRTAVSVGERALGALMRAAHLAAAHELPALIAEHAAVLGARDAVAYLVDLQQLVLVPFTAPAGPGVERHLPLAIDSTLAGRSFQHVEVVTHASAAGGGTRVWVPLLDGTERLGVLGVTVSEPAALEIDDGLLGVRLRHFAATVAELLVSKTLYGDTIVCARRLSEMGLAAEIQWGLLPPLTFASQEVVVAGALEPAYKVAGDSVDYAVDAGCARFAVFDGMGHGLQAAQLAVLAVSSYRSARRSGRSLSDTAHQVDGDVDLAFGGEAFTTAVLAELDTDTGVLTWVSAGHPAPLLLRQGQLVKVLRVPPGLPFGLGLPADLSSTYPVGSQQLQPEDQILLYTDGVTEARSPGGEFFGIDRLVDLLARHLAGGLPVPETMRRVVRSLLEYHQDQLVDDATMLLIEWRSRHLSTLLS
jgi:hypothetical protein